ncbi:MAG: ATP-binding protein [Acidobacteriaceae bacterium]|nr:ATP-binding protein [Acidobacteriaceae bacterium]
MIYLLKQNRSDASSGSLEEQLRNYALATHEGNMFQLRKPNGQLLFPAGSQESSSAFSFSGDCAKRTFQLVQIAGTPAMMMCHDIQLRGMPLRIYQGGSLSEEFDILRIYRNALFFLLPGLLLASFLCGYFLSRRAMQPVDRLIRGAVGIGIGNLSARVPVPEARDEVQQLAEAWNQLLDRLETAVSRLSEFSADVSHDLRTSITIMLATAQLALNGNHSELEYREDLDRIVEECRMAATLLDAMLSLVQSKNFSQEVSFQQINLCELVLNGCRRVEDLAESKAILLDWELPAQSVMIEGDEILLGRLLGILLDNAIKYTPESGEVRACVFVESEEVGVIVRDTGVGIAMEAQEKIFERYYQAELRESRTQAGSGLGLSIARWIVDAHRARISITSVQGEGASFRVSFLRAPSPSAAVVLPELT